jgi:hypothetical protein
VGIDLARDLGTPRLSWGRLARFIEHLPPDSATVRLRSNNAPPVDVLLLRRIEFWTHLTYWTKTKDGAKNRNAPKPVSLPSDDTGKDKQRDSLATDELLRQRQERRAAQLAAMQKGA